MKSLTDVRRSLKTIGFKLKTQSMSWGRHATFIHIESNIELTFNVFTPKTLAMFKPLREWQTKHESELMQVSKLEDCRGLTNLI